ncbi:hypothetical protein HDU98_004946 [Podochytrium sp. JEL0797]|nr:hypothetical protein HDU98_004946 [Podochytrium sp. JEL0797]
MPIGHSLPTLVALRTGTFIMDLIPLVATAYTTLQLYLLLTTPSTPYSPILPFPTIQDDTDLVTKIKNLLPAWSAIETAFFVYFHLQHKRIQEPTTPQKLSPMERGKMFYKFLDSSDVQFEEFFSGWFYWTKTTRQLKASEFYLVRRDNLRDWIAWSFFSVKNYDQLSHDPALVSELNGYISDMEMVKSIKIQPGRNMDISPVILNYNPIIARPKPLILYVFIWGFEAFGLLIMSLLGFKRVTPADRPYHHDSDATLNYWVYLPTTSSSDPQQESDKLPLVFLHGIGCGLFPYVHFLSGVMRHNPTRPLFVLEFPHVSMRLVDHVPSTQQTISEIETMLDIHGFAKAHFVGHSLGTTVAGSLINYSKYTASIVLLDPVVFMPLLPSLAFNFVYRHPGRNTDTIKANEYLLYWLCSRELYTSSALCRHFRWHHILVWPESMPKHSHVVVGKRDFLFDGQEVSDYLTEHGISNKAYDIGHGAFMLRPSISKEIQVQIARVCNDADAEFAVKWAKQSRASVAGGGNGRKSIRRRRG